jgi:hypothetical protein
MDTHSTGCGPATENAGEPSGRVADVLAAEQAAGQHTAEGFAGAVSPGDANPGAPAGADRRGPARLRSGAWNLREELVEQIIRTARALRRSGGRRV